MGVTLVKDALKYTQKCDLDHTHYDMRQGVGAQEMTIAEYTHFALDKFKSLSSTLWYNGLPLITFDYAFHMFSSKPNPCTNFSHSHNVHSQSQIVLVKLLIIKNRYSLSHVL